MNMLWKTGLLLACGLTLGTAQARDYDITKAVTTKDGCIFYTYPEYQVTSASWEGKCTPGADLEGKGTLRYEARYMDEKEGFIGNRVTTDAGVFKAGRLEGAGSRSRDFFDKEGRKFKEIRHKGNFQAGWKKGLGESIKDHFDVKTGQVYMHVVDKGNYQEDNLYKEARRVVTSPSYRRFDKKILDAEFYPGGDIRSARVTFTKTVLGGDIVFEGVLFEGGYEDTITGFAGGYGEEEIEGILRRSAGNIKIVVKWADLNKGERFLNSFKLIRDNWRVECYEAKGFDKQMMQCGEVEMHVKQPEFDFTSRPWEGAIYRLFDLSHIDDARHPNPELQALVEDRLRAERAARQYAQEEAERNSSFSRDEFQSCVRMSRQVDQMARDLDAEEGRLDDAHSSMMTAKAMIEAAHANGLNISTAPFYDRQNSYNEMVDNYNRNLERAEAKKDQYNSRCGKKGTVPTAYVETYCLGVETHFCGRWQKD
ncbi:MAG: hypothetical protein HGA75_10025 [Thiobacillus sp.]|nr:hypothetical protein [Thiobacillus sp.]